MKLNLKDLRVLLTRVFPAVLVVLLASGAGHAQDLSIKKQIWSPADLMQPADLLALQAGPAATKPLVYNIGFVGNIKGATKIGAASKEEGLGNLKKVVKGLPKSSTIVVYCGCCPFEHCPNVRPAYDLLKAEGFSKARILNLPTSIKVDWMDKGYPMEKK